MYCVLGLCQGFVCRLVLAGEEVCSRLKLVLEVSCPNGVYREFWGCPGFSAVRKGSAVNRCLGQELRIAGLLCGLLGLKLRSRVE